MANDTKIVKRAFNAGEISIRAKWRNDTEKHAYSCEKLENFYVSPLGAISRREGTRLLFTLDTDKEHRLVPFEYNNELSYLLDLTKGTRKIYAKNYFKTNNFILPKRFSFVFKITDSIPYTNVPLFSKGGFKIEIKKGQSQYDICVFLENQLYGNLPVLNINNSIIGIYYSQSKLTVGIFHSEDEIETKNFDSTTISDSEISSLEFLSSPYLREDEWLEFKIYDNINIFEEVAPFSVYEDWNKNPNESLANHHSGLDVNNVWSRFGSTFSKNGDVYSLKQVSYVQACENFEESIKTENSGMFEELETAISNYRTNPDSTNLENLKDKFTRAWDFDGSRDSVHYAGGYWEGLVVVWANANGENIYIPTNNIDRSDGEIFDVYFKNFLNDYDSAKSAFDSYFAEIETRMIDSILAGTWKYPHELTYTEYVAIPFEDYKNFDIDINSEIYGFYLVNNSIPESDLRDSRHVPARFIENVVYKGDYELKVPDVERMGYLEGWSSSLPLSTGEYSLYEMSDFQELLNDGAVSHIIVKIELDSNSEEVSKNIEVSARGECLDIIHKYIDGELEYESIPIVNVDAYDKDGNIIVEKLDTGISIEALNEIQIKQVNGYLYLVHGSIPPKRIRVKDSVEWVVEDAVKIEPTQEQEIQNEFERIENGGLSYADSRIIMKSKTFAFSPEMVGQQMKIDYVSEATSKRYEYWASDYETYKYLPKYSDVIAGLGKIVLRPEGGVWHGVLVLEESIDNGKTWNEIGRSTSTQGSENIEIVREVYNVNSLIRVCFKDYEVVSQEHSKIESSQNGCFYYFYNEGTSSAWGIIENVINEKEVQIKLITPLGANPVVKNVYLSQWNKEFGYPRTVAIHEERLTLGGSKAYPSTVWLSETNNWDNFRSVSNLDTDPLSYTLASDDGMPINWLVSREDLMIGLNGSAWSLGSRDSNSALTSSIVKASEQTADGTEYVEPCKAGNMVVYIRRGGLEMASIVYDFASDGYTSTSLTTMNPEILGDGVVGIFNQLSPRNEIWAVRKDGICVVFRYDKENNVAAWGRMTFGEGVLSACAVSSGKYRSIFLVVKRDGYLCLERLDPNELGTDNWLDCVPINVDVNIPEGLKTSVKYESVVKTTPVFLEGAVKVFDVKLYLINSLGGKFRMVGFNLNGDETADEWRNILPRESEFLQEAKPRNYRYVGACDVGYLEEGSIEISTDETAPFELTAIGIKAKG